MDEPGNVGRGRDRNRAGDPNREWDAATYDQVADPMARWGATVLDRLPLRGDERVLDAGCGSGRVTELLVDRVPEGHVVALDASSAMLAEARRRLERFGSRISFVEADLMEPLPVAEPVDAILSTAVFHWVPDHDILFRNLAAVLRSGGRLVAQCGGSGNVARLEAVLRELGHPRRGGAHFESPEDTEARLAAAGFTGIRTWLHEEPTRIEPRTRLETFLEAVCLREVLPGIPAAERTAFVRDVAARLPGSEIDYVRLNIVATRR